MRDIEYKLFDIVEMKKEHPCDKRSKLFQVIRLGADIKIMCLGCGSFIMMERELFNHRIRKVIEHKEEQIKVSK